MSESTLKMKSQYRTAIEELKAEKRKYADLCDELTETIESLERYKFGKSMVFGFSLGVLVTIMTYLIIH